MGFGKISSKASRKIYRVACGGMTSVNLEDVKQKLAKKQDEARQHRFFVPWKKQSTSLREIFDKVSVSIERFVKVTDTAIK